MFVVLILVLYNFPGDTASLRGLTLRSRIVMSIGVGNSLKVERARPGYGRGAKCIF